MQRLESSQKTSHLPSALRVPQLPQSHHAAPRLVPRYIRAKRRHLARRPPPCLVRPHSIPALACPRKRVHPLPLRARARPVQNQCVLGQFCQDTDLAGDGAGAGRRPAGPCLSSAHNGAAEDAVLCHARSGFDPTNTLGCNRNRMP